MNEVTGVFAWPSERTAGQECRVSVRERNGSPLVYIDVYEDGAFKRNSATFLSAEVPQIIEALQKAQLVLNK